jgi:hypothetical protein
LFLILYVSFSQIVGIIVGAAIIGVVGYASVYGHFAHSRATSRTISIARSCPSVIVFHRARHICAEEKSKVIIPFPSELKWDHPCSKYKNYFEEGRNK